MHKTCECIEKLRPLSKPEYLETMSYPHLVVAVICQQNDTILMVNEIDNGINCWNQPAGHVEAGESISQAAVREALEETGYKVELTGIQGIYEGVHKQSGTHYVRVCFTANATELTNNTLDSDIIKAEWLPRQDLLRDIYPLRSEITRITLEDAGKAPIVPLSFVHNLNLGEPSWNQMQT